jgi:DNA invertase Pin-like site-specific DNA recombinase
LARSKAGMKIARDKGVHCGRPRALTDHQRRTAAERIAAGESKSAIARDFNVNVRTIRRLRVQLENWGIPQ